MEEERIKELEARARAAHPDVELPEGIFAAHLRERVDEESDAAALHVEDLYLACACVCGDATALEVFEERYGKDIDRGLAKLQGGGDADREQVVRARLFVGDDDHPPKLASYKGTGELLHWLRVTVVRMRVDFARTPQRADSPSKEEPHISKVVSPEEDPEYRYLREHYGGVLKEAFETSLTQLSRRTATSCANTSWTA